MVYMVLTARNVATLFLPVQEDVCLDHSSTVLFICFGFNL